MGCHRNRLDKPIKFLWFFFIFDLTCPPRTPLKLSRQPSQRVISRVGPKLGFWGIIGVASKSRSKFFKYLTSLIPPGPLRRVPAVSQKGHFQNRTKTRVVGYQQDWLNAPVNFLNLFLNFWPHMSHQDPSWRSRQPPKRVISRIQKKPWIWGVMRVVSMSP